MGFDDAPIRKTMTQTITTVRQVMPPLHGQQPPSLGQLREFVAACEGLEDHLAVHVDRSDLNEAGKYHYTFSIRIVDEAS